MIDLSRPLKMARLPAAAIFLRTLGRASRRPPPKQAAERFEDEAAETACPREWGSSR
jgi:hypothetical protein